MNEENRREPKKPDSTRIDKALSLLLEADAEHGPPEQWDAFQRLQNQRLARSIACLRLPPERVEDVLQEVWLATLARWDSFRGLDGTQHLLVWSRRVARNKAVDLIRRLKKRRAGSLNIEPLDISAVRTASQAENSEMLDALLGVLRREQPTNCYLLCEHHLANRPTKELAEETGLTEHAIHNRINRGLKRLSSLGEEAGYGAEDVL